METLQTPLDGIGVIVCGILVLSLVEAAIPLVARTRRHRAHFAPNVALTGLTFATAAASNGVLALALGWPASRELGLLPGLALGALPSAVIALLALDLATYVGHVALHKIPWLWRFHAIHHADPFVDVTTTLRQHPVEGAVRFLVLAAVALPLGTSPGTLAVYRLASALSGLLEHANVRLPERIDTRLSLVVPWPNFHKVHHSREPRLADSNYGNLVSWWDRLFGTFTPARFGAEVVSGLASFDAPATQTIRALLVAPFRSAPTRPPRSASGSSGAS